jgi:ankyrin repeat protein
MRVYPLELEIKSNIPEISDQLAKIVEAGEALDLTIKGKLSLIELQKLLNIIQYNLDSLHLNEITIKDSEGAITSSNSLEEHSGFQQLTTLEFFPAKQTSKATAIAMMQWLLSRCPNLESLSLKYYSEGKLKEFDFSLYTEELNRVISIKELNQTDLVATKLENSPAIITGKGVPLTAPVSTPPIQTLLSNAFIGSASKRPTAAKSIAAAVAPSPVGPSINPHPMALAGGNGHTECIKVLMEYGAQVDERNPADDTTALHSSITGNRLETVKFLLEKGADVMLPTKTGVNALMLAAGQKTREYLDVIFLCKPSIDVNAEVKGWSAVMSAASKGRLENLKFLVEKGGSLTNLSKNNFTLLQLAAQDGHLDVVQWIWKKMRAIRADKVAEKYVNDQNKTGWTALHCAAFYGDDEVVGYLLDLGADLFSLDVAQESGAKMKAILRDKSLENYLNHQNKFGRTALYCAAFDGHAEVVDYLLDLGANPFIDSKDGWTVIMLLARVGNNAALQRVLAMIPDPELKSRINSGTFEKWTALHSAASRNHPETVKILLENGGDMLQTDAGILTPLACAVQQGHVEVMKAMLEFASTNNLLQEIRNVHDKLKVSLLHLAAESKNCQDPEMINVLLQYGFDAAPRDQFATLESEKSTTPFSKPKSPAALAVEYGKSESFVDAFFPWSDDELLKDPEKVQELLNKNPSLAISVNEHGENALHLAFRLAYLESAKVLMESLRLSGKLTSALQQKPLKDPQSGDPLLTPLHVAIMHRQHAAVSLQAIQLCMVEGLNPKEDIISMLNVQDAASRTPLFLAVLAGDVKWVEALIKTGADITIKGFAGGELLYPLNLAQRLQSNAERAPQEEQSNRIQITMLLREKTEDLQRRCIASQSLGGQCAPLPGRRF